MFYKNLNNGKIKYKKYSLSSFNSQMNNKDDEKILPFGVCDRIYNFNTSTGALTDGMGIGEIEVVYNNFYDVDMKIIDNPQDPIESTYFLKYWNQTLESYDYILIIYCMNGKAYYNVVSDSYPSWMEIKNITFTVKPIALYSKVNGVDCLIFYSKKDGMQVWNILSAHSYKVDNPPQITSMCIHQNRLFATIEGEARSIIFSEELNPVNFNVNTNEGGYINMDDEFGKCNKVISFDGYLYVFRDYNIAKISEGKDKNEFIVDQVYVGNGNIYPNTVAVCGNKIMFLASDGIYEFNGSVSKKINFDFDNMIDKFDNYFSVAKYCNGCYYLACNINFEDGYVFPCEEMSLSRNNSLIKINITNYECEIMRGCDIKELTVIDDGLNNCIVATYNWDSVYSSIGQLNNSGCIMDNNLRKIWKSKMYDFGIPDKAKYIKDITFVAKSDMEVLIYLDDKLKQLKVYGGESCQKIKINERAIKFGFGFVTDKNGVYISVPQVKVGFYGESK